MVDRSTFETELAALRVREKAHTRKGDVGHDAPEGHRDAHSYVSIPAVAAKAHSREI